MSVTAHVLPALESTFARDLPELAEPWQARPVEAPQLLALNEELAAELGADPDVLRSPEGLAVLTGTAVPEGAHPVAQAYSGHQFGNFSPRLGDGRALLLGEVVDPAGRRRDLHLKGSGATPWSRGGDGLAAVGPMLREWVVGEALHALGVPCTRALAVIGTGGTVVRERPLPGALLVRVAASHLRVGTVEYASTWGDNDLVRRVADHAIARHHPEAAGAEQPYVALFEAVVDVQAALVARWMLLGFVHGVMNTDNVTLSGEAIDFGPCAFMEAYDPRTTFSSIDAGGRYAFGNQPAIAQWDLARLAEAMLPLFDAQSDRAVERATAVLETFPDRFLRRWRAGMCEKLGLADGLQTDEALIDDLLATMHREGTDWTSGLRALGEAARGNEGPAAVLLGEAWPAWSARWRALLPDGGGAAVGDAMDAVNPVYVPRNHLVEEALAAATEGDAGPVHALVDAVRRPYERRPGLERYAEPAPAAFGRYRTFCGT